MWLKFSHNDYEQLQDCVCCTIIAKLCYRQRSQIKSETKMNVPLNTTLQAYISARSLRNSKLIGKCNGYTGWMEWFT